MSCLILILSLTTVFYLQIIPAIAVTTIPATASSIVSAATAYIWTTSYSSTTCSSKSLEKIAVIALGLCSGTSSTYTRYTSTGTAKNNLLLLHVRSSTSGCQRQVVNVIDTLNQIIRNQHLLQFRVTDTLVRLQSFSDHILKFSLTGLSKNGYLQVYVTTYADSSCAQPLASTVKSYSTSCADGSLSRYSQSYPSLQGSFLVTR